MVRASVPVAIAIALLPAAASAGNGLKPRTLVQWVDAPCMTLVDRSAEAVLHVPYAILVEDPAPGESITEDEVPDSRTHQFFAFSREADPIDILPSWITDADVAAAVAAGIIMQGAIDPDNILEDVPAWDGAWIRLTPDDARRPITFEMAEQGVDWDTAGAPIGVYNLQGYTWEPEINVWSARDGVVKVHDGDPDAAGPAVALEQIDLILYRNGSAVLTGCIDAPADTTVIGEWTRVEANTPLSWEAFGEAGIDGGTLEIEFAAPEGAAGGFVALRLVATSPSGQSYTAYMRALASVLLEDDPEACDEGGGFVGMPGCADSGSDSDGGSGGGTTAEPGSTGSGGGPTSAGTTAPPQTGEPQGCGCASDRGRGGALVLVALWGVVRRRRQNSQ